ncbi:MAG: electron transporter [Mucilaginibacter sp.]|nr:electron transporter [Mucilaginibacter sp.]
MHLRAYVISMIQVNTNLAMFAAAPLINNKLLGDLMRKKRALEIFQYAQRKIDTRTNASARVNEPAFYKQDSCPDICPVIQRNMLKLYQKYRNNRQVRLLSHTIDPDHDTSSKLKWYAKKLGVEDSQWEFLRGSKQVISSLAKNDYMVSIDDDTKGPGGFAHEGYLVLVDKEKRMRGVYDGTNEQEIKKLMKDMDILLAEHTK